MLAWAKRCIYEKGIARTTARDVATASGVSLAAIGYRLRLAGSAAQRRDDGGDRRLGRRTRPGPADDTGGGPIEQLAATWARVIASLTEHRALWVANFEGSLLAERSPELRAQLTAGQQLARSGMAACKDEVAVSEAEARSVGSFQLALLSGLIAQWLADPERAPPRAIWQMRCGQSRRVSRRVMQGRDEADWGPGPPTEVGAKGLRPRSWLKTSGDEGQCLNR